MGLEIGIQLIKDVFVNSTILGSSWLWQLVFLFGSMAIISRNISDWKSLALPLVTGWHLIGFHFSWIFFGISGIVFVLENLSTKVVDSAIAGVGGALKGSMLGKQGREKRMLDIRKSRKERMDVRDEIRKLDKKYKKKQLKGEEPFKRGTSISDIMEMRKSYNAENIMEKKEKKKKKYIYVKEDTD